MNDTPLDVQTYLIEQFRALSPNERLQRGFGLVEMGWKMAEVAVKRDHPHLSGRDLQLAVFRWMYGKGISLVGS